jgi:ERCC4-type nuclease
VATAELIEIHVDIHEQDSEVAHYISARDLGVVIIGHMVTGDVVLMYRGYTVGIEIKRGADFDNSLKSGRIHDQLCRLTESYDFPILIVEDWHPYVGREDDAESISEKKRKHDMTIRTLNRRVATYETPHLEATLDLVEELCRDLKKNKINVLRRPVKVEEDMMDQMKFICSLPNVKRVLGERILDRYKTPENALANLDNWTEIDGIGKVKLARIKRTLKEESE